MDIEQLPQKLMKKPSPRRYNLNNRNLHQHHKTLKQQINWAFK